MIFIITIIILIFNNGNYNDLWLIVDKSIVILSITIMIP